MGALLLIGGLLAALALGGRGSKPKMTPDKGGLSNIRQLAIAAGAPPEWQDFFVLVARGESGGNNLVGLGHAKDFPPFAKRNNSDSEAKAAAAAFKNHPELNGCWPAGLYGFGSGGWFGLLPAYGLAAFEDDAELKCLHPWSVFDGPLSIVMAVKFARRLSQWKTWDGTVLGLRVGWGDPSAMGSSSKVEAKRAKFVEDCLEVGLPASFLDEKLPNWKPASPRELIADVGAQPQGWLP
jgi:hypothetical protein